MGKNMKRQLTESEMQMPGNCLKEGEIRVMDTHTADGVSIETTFLGSHLAISIRNLKKFRVENMSFGVRLARLNFVPTIMVLSALSVLLYLFVLLFLSFVKWEQ